MRIDIGPQGQIVGTKRVGPGGQVAGLSDHVGKDVLIVVPEGRASFHFSFQDYLHDWQKAAQRGVKKARTEIKRLESRLPEWSRVETARARLETLQPKQLQTRLGRQVRRLRKDPRVQRVEARFEHEVHRIRKDPRVKKVEARFGHEVQRLRADPRVKQVEGWVRKGLSRPRPKRGGRRTA